MQKKSRRNFLKTTTVVSAGFMIVPRHVLGGVGYVAPSDKLNIAGIGVGGKGEGDLAEFAKSKYVNIVALCDVDERQALKSRNKFKKAVFYHDFRKMLDKENKNIDAVSVSTPDHVHAVATYDAMSRGKHVYVQKPLTHSIHEARVLTEAAKKFKVVTQMGNQAGSGEGVRQMQELYEAGWVGETHTVKCWTNRPIWPQALKTPTNKMKIPKELKWDLWLGPAPMRDYNSAYLPFNWRGWNRFGTGALGDMACHVMDPAFRILPIDFPNTVECSVAGSYESNFKELQFTDSFPTASKIQFNFPRVDGKGDIKIIWTDGGILPDRPSGLDPNTPLGDWNGGIIFEGDKGILFADCYGENPRLLPSGRMDQIIPPKKVLSRVPEGHYLQWVNACRVGYEDGITSSPFQYAGPFTESILLGNLAIRSYFEKDNTVKSDNFWSGNLRYKGRKQLMWDAKKMQITNYELGNQFVKNSYRSGYNLGQ